MAKSDLKEVALLSGERISIASSEKYQHNHLIRLGESLVVALVSNSKTPRIDVFQEDPTSGFYVKAHDITWERDGHIFNFWEINVRYF